MSGISDYNAARASRPQPLSIFSADELEGKEIPSPSWLIDGILIRRSITMLNGAGGVGKSLLMLQMQVACALGQPWLGISIPERISSFGFYCEDDREEIHRRLAQVCKSYNCTFADLKDYVRISCRVGEENELMTFQYRGDSGGKLSPLYSQLKEEVKLYNHQLMIIDTVADTFGGNENIRPQARGFINALRRLTLGNNGGVIITAHPSRAGVADGSGLSGSTGWEGSVRCRIYFTKPRSPDKDVEGEDEPTDERVLKVMKSNYGQAGTKIRCKYNKGVFEPTEKAAGFKSKFNKLDDDRKLLEAAGYLITRGVFLGAAPQSKTGLAAQARKLPSCRDIAWNDLLSAQDRLLANGKMILTEMGPPTKRRVYIRPSHVRYPGEKDDDSGEHKALTNTATGETDQEHPGGNWERDLF